MGTFKDRNDVGNGPNERQPSKEYQKKLTEEHFEVVQLRAICLLQNYKIILHKMYRVMENIGS